MIAAGERLFAEHGVESTTVAAIVKAAGQRNNYAVGFHFGDKDGLLDAILAKHRDRVETARQALLAEAGADAGSGTGDVGDVEFVARALVEPLVDRLRDPDGGADYLRIQADLASRAQRYFPEQSPPGVRRLLELSEPFAGRTDSTTYLEQTNLILVVVFHGLANYAGRPPSPSDEDLTEFSSLLVRNVVAMMTSAAARAAT